MAPIDRPRDKAIIDEERLRKDALTEAIADGKYNSSKKEQIALYYKAMERSWCDE